MLLLEKTHNAIVPSLRDNMVRQSIKGKDYSGVMDEAWNLVHDQVPNEVSISHVSIVIIQD